MSSLKVNLSEYNNSFSFRNKLARLIWNICFWILFRPFGSNIDRKVNQFSHYNCHYAMNNYTEEKFSSKIIEILNKVNASKVRKI